MLVFPNSKPPVAGATSFLSVSFIGPPNVKPEEDDDVAVEPLEEEPKVNPPLEPNWKLELSDEPGRYQVNLYCIEHQAVYLTIWTINMSTDFSLKSAFEHYR